MKRLSLLTLALALGLGPAYAQNITKSLQGSQDPRGPVGVDISNSAFFPNHINGFGQTTSATGLACGAGATINGGSTDTAGGAFVRSNQCTVLFGSPFNNPPNCVVTSGVASGASPGVSTSTVSMSVAGTNSGFAINWICIGNQ